LFTVTASGSAGMSTAAPVAASKACSPLMISALSRAT
jgi:hypothetical protein